MPAEPFKQGGRIRISASFTDEGVLTDPTTVSVKIQNPAGIWVMNAEKDDTGVYHVDVDLETAGRWSYVFLGDGLVRAVDDGEFHVTPTAV